MAWPGQETPPGPGLQAADAAVECLFRAAVRTGGVWKGNVRTAYFSVVFELILPFLFDL